MVEVIHSLDRGRGLSARVGLLRGAVALSSLPFVYTLSKSQKGLRCDHCLERQKALLRCSGCKYMKYCNRSCQKGSWIRHKPECSALKRVSPKIPPDFVILLSRVLWKLEESLDKNESDNIVSLVDLESNYTRLSESQKEVLGHFVVILHSYWGQGKLPLQVPDIKAVLELCAKLKNNCFAISDEEMQTDIGTGVYLSCSLLNHSCDPNCVVEFDKLQLNVRALRDIDPDEELLISYIDLFAPSELRQKNLMEIYRFTCKCVSCTTGKNDKKMIQDFNGVMSQSKLEAVNDFLRQLEGLRAAGGFQQMFELATSYINREVLPQENVYMAKVLDFAMDAAIEIENYEDAFRYGVLALRSYRKYLHEFHPMTGIQILKLGKILLYLNKNKEALEMLLESLKILQVTHSSNGIVMKQLRELIGQSRCELRHEDAAEDN